LSRLDESDSRSSETDSPRRDLAHKQEMSFWCFRSGESCSLKQKYQIPNLFSHATVKKSSTTKHTLNYTIQALIQQSIMQFKVIRMISIQNSSKTVSFPDLLSCLDNFTNVNTSNFIGCSIYT